MAKPHHLRRASPLVARHFLSGVLFAVLVIVTSQALFRSRSPPPQPTIARSAVHVETNRATLHQLWEVAQTAESSEEFMERLEGSSIKANKDNANTKDTDAKSSSLGSKSGSGDGASASDGGSVQQKTVREKKVGTQQQTKPKSGSSGDVSSDLSLTKISGVATTIEDRLGTIGNGGPVSRLTKELALQHSSDNVIMITCADEAVVDFALNWGQNVVRNNISNYLIGAADASTAQVLASHGLAVFSLYGDGSMDIAGMAKAAATSESAKAKLMQIHLQKVAVTLQLLGYGLDVVLSDADAVWLQNPNPFLAKYRDDVDILVALDRLSTTVPAHDIGLEHPSTLSSGDINTGILFFKHSTASVQFGSQWLEAMVEDDSLTEQEAFDKLLKQGDLEYASNDITELVYGEERLAKAFKRKLSIGALPVASFAPGHVYSVQKLHDTLNVVPFVVQETFQYGGMGAKTHRLREAKLWVDSPDYYNNYTNRLYLTVNLTALVAPEGFESWSNVKMVQYHLDSMIGQLREVRAAMGIALALNRTLIMPKLYCFCDKHLLATNRCRVGTSNYSLPFICPLDHIMQPEKLAEWIDFREHSYLENRRTHWSVRKYTVDVEAADTIYKVQERVDADTKRKVTLPSHQSEDKIAEMLKFDQDTVLLKLVTPPSQMFTGFMTESKSKEFMRRFRDSLDVWCCFKVPYESDDKVYMYKWAFPGENEKQKLPKMVVKAGSARSRRSLLF